MCEGRTSVASSPCAGVDGEAISYRSWRQYWDDSSLGVLSGPTPSTFSVRVWKSLVLIDFNGGIYAGDVMF